MIDWENIVFPAISVIVSSAISVWQAKKTARSEIEKLQAVWSHEKEIACDADFDKMVTVVSMFAKKPSPGGFRDAENAVAVYRAKAEIELAPLVDQLSALIVDIRPDCNAISQKLSDIISWKRNHS